MPDTGETLANSCNFLSCFWQRSQSQNEQAKIDSIKNRERRRQQEIQAMEESIARLREAISDTPPSEDTSEVDAAIVSDLQEWCLMLLSGLSIGRRRETADGARRGHSKMPSDR